jgi:hypothetical protein
LAGWVIGEGFAVKVPRGAAFGDRRRRTPEGVSTSRQVVARQSIATKRLESGILKPANSLIANYLGVQ